MSCPRRGVHRARPDRVERRRGALPAGHGGAPRRHRGRAAGGLRAHCRAGAASRVRAAGRRRARRETHPPPAGGRAMSARQNAQIAALEALIEAHATELKLPTHKARFRQMAAGAVREQQTPVAYLAALLEAELHERAERRERRRLLDARSPLLKRIEEFRFADNPKIPQATPRSPSARGSATATRSCWSATAVPARHISRSVSPCVPANKAGASGSPPSLSSRTSSKKPTAVESSPESSAATPEPRSSCLTSWAISACPTVPPSSSSK